VAVTSEIAANIFPISIFAHLGNLQFHHYLVKDDEPLLFHIGLPRDARGASLIRFKPHQRFRVAAYLALHTAHRAELEEARRPKAQNASHHAMDLASRVTAPGPLKHSTGYCKRMVWVGDVSRKYPSDAMASIHETMETLHKVRAIDRQTKRRFDDACLTPVQALSPKQIKALREQEHVTCGQRRCKRQV
jgi:hypothetical protein